jgi:hypothetical protein
LHLEALAEPSVKLSPHSAPIRQTYQSIRFANVRRYASYTKRLSILNGLLVVVACIEFILLPVVSVMPQPDPTPLLAPLQSPHRSYESVRPSAPLRYYRLAVLAA